MTWSEKVLAILDKMKISQRKLAEISEQTAPYINDIIKGKNANPSAKFVASLAKIGISAKWLLKDEGDIMSDKDNNIRIPLLDARISAGNGCINDCDGMTDTYLEIEKELALKYADKRIFGVRVSGDSMEPTYRNGDIVFVAEGLIDGEGVYVVIDGDTAFLKRVQFVPEKNQLILISDNKAYPPRVFDLNTHQRYVRIFGAVIGVFQLIK